mmetsp:Transcript_2347/g.5065  ORF Transcript_2347/g.5065 Transcript_2347/m.5065 type:complete len:86 (+) Transcript_2347:619-876(+)
MLYGYSSKLLKFYIHAKAIDYRYIEICWHILFGYCLRIVSFPEFRLGGIISQDILQLENYHLIVSTLLVLLPQTSYVIMYQQLPW